MKRNSAAEPLGYFPKFRAIRSRAVSGLILYFTQQFIMFWISSVGPATCKVKIRSRVSCIWLTYPHWLLTVSGYQGLSAILWQSAQPDCYVSKLSDTVIPFVVARELLICAKSGILAQTPGSARPAVSPPPTPLASPVRTVSIVVAIHTNRCCRPGLWRFCPCPSPAPLLLLLVCRNSNY